MKTSKSGKIVFFILDKTFDGGGGAIVERMEQAYVWDMETTNEGILCVFNSDYKKQADIWKVKVTIETIKDTE
jgi:hypothetical protein